MDDARDQTEVGAARWLQIWSGGGKLPIVENAYLLTFRSVYIKQYAFSKNI